MRNIRISRSRKILPDIEGWSWKKYLILFAVAGISSFLQGQPSEILECSQLKWHPLWLHTGLQFTLVQAYAIHLCSALLAESAQVRRKIQIQAKLYLSISKMNFTLIEFKSNTQFMNSKYGFLLWIMMDTWKTRSQPWRIPEIKWGSNRH